VFRDIVPLTCKCEIVISFLYITAVDDFSSSKMSSAGCVNEGDIYYLMHQ